MKNDWVYEQIKLIISFYVFKVYLRTNNDIKHNFKFKYIS